MPNGRERNTQTDTKWLRITNTYGERATAPIARGATVDLEFVVKAVRFHNTRWRQVLAFIAGQFHRRAFLTLGPLQFDELEEPAVRGPQWSVVDTRLCGICGSDTKQAFLEGRPDNPLTSIISFPHVLGHEQMGVVKEAGAESPLAKGTRVALYSSIACAVRGTVPPCRFCALGFPPLCENLTAGPLAPAIHIGNSRDLVGGFAERLSAHTSQLFAVPDSVSDELAMIADTAGVALQPLLRHPPRPDRPLLIYGLGSIGLCAVGLARVLYPKAEVWAVGKYEHQRAMARKLGAHRVFASKPVQLIEELAQASGSPIRRPWFGLPWLERGVGTVYDTVASAETLETSMRVVDKRGLLVELGVASPKRFEWTMLYFKELEVQGSNAFGWIEFEGERAHCYEVYWKLLARGLDLSPLVTHRFGLKQWQDALLCARERERNGAIKVALVAQGG